MPGQAPPSGSLTLRLLTSNTVLTTVMFVLVFESGILAVFPGSGQSGWPTWAHLLAGIIYLLPVVFLIRTSRWLFAFAVPVAAISLAAASWFMARYGVVVNADMLAAIAATNTGEAGEFLSWEIVFWIIATGLVASAFSVWLFQRRPAGRSKLKLFSLVGIVLFAAVGARLYVVPAQYLFKPFDLQIDMAPANAGHITQLALKLWPEDDLSKVNKVHVSGGRLRFDISSKTGHERLKLYAGKGDFSIHDKYFRRTFDRHGKHLETRLINSSIWRGLRPKDFLIFRIGNAIVEFTRHRAALARARSSLMDIAALPSELDENVARNLTVVLVIGESARSDRFSLNGYNRVTTPELAKIENLVSFPDVTSCAASSTVAVPCMLTRMATSDLPDEYQRSQLTFPSENETRRNEPISLSWSKSIT